MFVSQPFTDKVFIGYDDDDDADDFVEGYSSLVVHRSLTANS